MLRSELNIPTLGNGNHLSLSTSLLTPPQTPFLTGLCLESSQQQLSVQNKDLRAVATRVAPMIEPNDHMSWLTPDTSYPPPKTSQLTSNTQDEQMSPNVQPLMDVPTVEDELCSLTTTLTSDSTPFPTTLTTAPSVLWGSATPPIYENHSDEVPVRLNCTIAVCTSTSTHTSNVGQGLLAQGQLGNLKGNGKDVGPNELGQLMVEYSSMETSILSILSLGELTLDLIVDRGENRTRGLRRYHLVKATLDNICMVVMAQQTFVQRAAALMVEGKSQFIVDPKDTLIPILQGTNSLPQLYVAWKALMARMRLGVKTWGKYVTEYQLQVGAHC